MKEDDVVYMKKKCGLVVCSCGCCCWSTSGFQFMFTDGTLKG